MIIRISTKHILERQSMLVLFLLEKYTEIYEDLKRSSNFRKLEKYKISDSQIKISNEFHPTIGRLRP